jgi:hypothetical protein
MAGIKPTDVQKALKGASYPTDAEHLAEKARSNKAPKEVVEKIQGLREKRFEGPDDVQKAVFGK